MPLFYSETSHLILTLLTRDPYKPTARVLGGTVENVPSTWVRSLFIRIAFILKPRIALLPDSVTDKYTNNQKTKVIIYVDSIFYKT